MELVGTLGPTSFNRHLVSRQQKRKEHRRSLFLALMLTPMVDMFSLLVIFLLQTFSASPELLVITKGVTLPQAASGREIKDSPVLSVSNDGLYLDQKMIGPVEAILHRPAPLMEKLSDLREHWMKAHPTESFRGEITLQADREIPSTTISQLMAMLPSQHYGSIQLAVISGGG